MTRQVMSDYAEYERAREVFEWSLPDSHNPVTDCLLKHPDLADRLALVDAALGARYTAADLDAAAGRLANALAARDIEPGDRIGVVARYAPSAAANFSTGCGGWSPTWTFSCVRQDVTSATTESPSLASTS